MLCLSHIAWEFPMQVRYLFLSEGCLSGKLYLNDGITHECGICISCVMSLPPYDCFIEEHIPYKMTAYKTQFNGKMHQASLAQESKFTRLKGQQESQQTCSTRTELLDFKILTSLSKTYCICAMPRLLLLNPVLYY